MTLHATNETPMQRFPTPELQPDQMTLTHADHRLPPKQFTLKRLNVIAALDAFLPGRKQIIIGVTKKLQVASGGPEGAMHPGRAYQIDRMDFIKMKLDLERGPYIMCLEPRVPCMYFEVCAAINQLWPRQGRNTFLANA
jgi:hypothetical protein